MQCLLGTRYLAAQIDPAAVWVVLDGCFLIVNKIVTSGTTRVFLEQGNIGPSMAGIAGSAFTRRFTRIFCGFRISMSPGSLQKQFQDVLQEKLM